MHGTWIGVYPNSAETNGALRGPVVVNSAKGSTVVLKYSHDFSGKQTTQEDPVGVLSWKSMCGHASIVCPEAC